MASNSALTNQARAVARGKRLEYFTIGWNSLEGLIALLAGFLAGSVALVGFGFDSAIEVTSGAALLWRLHRGERAERATLRMVGACFVTLAIYVAYDSARTSTVPEDLEGALKRNAKARRFFEALDRANRYAILFRLQTAKKAETRARRLAGFLKMLERGRKIH